MPYPVSYRPNSSPQQSGPNSRATNVAATVGRTAAGVLAGEAAWAAAGGGVLELAGEAALVRYGPQLVRTGAALLGNLRPPGAGFLGWVGAVFGAWALGRAIGDVLGDLFKPQMVSSLLTQYDYVQTSDCGIPWVIMSDVYDYPVCGPAFNVPELPAGLSTHRPAAITMWGEQVGTFAGNPDRRGSQKWMRTVAAGASVRGFPAVGLPRALARPSVPALGIFPGVLDWSEPIAVPLSLVAAVPFIPGVREGGNRAPVAMSPVVGVYHFEISINNAPGRPGTTGSGVRNPVRVVPGAVPQVRPSFWQRERKMLNQTRAGRAMIATLRTYAFFGDFNGAVNALWKALPPWSRTKGAGPVQKWLDVVNNLDRIDPVAAVAQAAVFASNQFLRGAMETGAREMAIGLFGERFGWGVARAGTTLVGSQQRLGRLAQRDAREDARGP